jgi:hypothetical protein
MPLFGGSVCCGLRSPTILCIASDHGIPCILSVGGDNLQYRPCGMDNSTAIWYGVGTVSWCASLSIKPMSETHIGGIAVVLGTGGVVQCSRV